MEVVLYLDDDQLVFVDVAQLFYLDLLFFEYVLLLDYDLFGLFQLVLDLASLLVGLMGVFVVLAGGAVVGELLAFFLGDEVVVGETILVCHLILYNYD